MAELLHPNYEVKVNDTTFSTLKSGLVSLRVERNIGLPIDNAEIQLSQSSELKIKKGDPVKVDLGYDSRLDGVFSGVISDIKHEVSTVKVTALGLTVKLLKMRLNRVYLAQSAGKIFENIAQEAKIEVETVSDGISFSTYTVTEKMNCFEHILHLAKKCNFNVFLSEDNKLVFQEHKPREPIEIRYGKEIMAIQETSFSPIFSSVKVLGESPSSIKGSETSHWLTKQDVKGESGTESVLVLVDPSIRETKTAGQVASARAAEMACTMSCTVTTVGLPQVSLDGTLSFVNLPHDFGSDKFEVRSYEHYLSKTKGFITRINCRQENPI
jgi:phage protein D